MFPPGHQSRYTSTRSTPWTLALGLGLTRIHEQSEFTYGGYLVAAELLLYPTRLYCLSERGMVCACREV